MEKTKIDLELIDDADIQHYEPSSLKNAIAWWEKKRIWFNVTVGFSGISAILISANNFNVFDVIDLVFYGFVLNFLYSIGFLIEAFDNHYLNGKLNTYRFRLFLFLLGTAASCLVTFTFETVFYANVVF